MKEKCKGCNKYDKKEDKCKRIGRNGKSVSVGSKKNTKM